MTSGSLQALPVAALGDAFFDAFSEGPVVLTSPPGSGKSTLVPLWAAELAGRAVVVEPRRVACRSLARYVAGVRGAELGREIGYAVRHEDAASAGTRVTYVTPGIAIRWLGDRIGAGDAVVLDEFHERSLELDLLLAALLARGHRSLAVLSATIEGRRVAEHIGGTLLEAEGREYPVDIRHIGDDPVPSRRRLPERVHDAVAGLRAREGDVLVFLPGKAEIAACAERLASGSPFEPVPLHGSLSPPEQDRAFDDAPGRRAILATNAAETSITLPRVRAVIDTGLVRRTIYREGRGALALVPIAADSAAQRAGRAGRVAPGECVRLWSRTGVLEPRTPPAILREDLSQLVLWALSLGENPAALPWLDPPPDYALGHARELLASLGILRPDGPGFSLTPEGRQVGRMPVDPALGRLIAAGAEEGAIGDAILLAAALSADRSLFSRGEPSLPDAGEDDELTSARCDATALVLALRDPHKHRHRLARGAAAEVRRDAEQIARLLGETLPARGAPFSRERLLCAAVRAFPGSAFAKRPRRQAWGNGEVEVTLSRDSLVDAEEVDTIVVVDQHVSADKGRAARRIATCAMPAPPSLLYELGAGRVETADAAVSGGAIVCTERWLIGTTELLRRERVPDGDAARRAAKLLLHRGELFPEAVDAARDHIEAYNLDAAMSGKQGVDFDAWLADRLDELGFESGDDLALLSPADFEPGLLSREERARIDRAYPRALHLGDQDIRVHYETARRHIRLELVRGRFKPPRTDYLPAWPGWRISYTDNKRTVPIRS